MAAIIKTMSEEAPIKINFCEYSKYALNGGMTDVNGRLAKYHV
jgi:hypothetical protein